MSARTALGATAAIAILGLVACKTTQSPAPNSAGQVSASTPTPVETPAPTKAQ